MGFGKEEGKKFYRSWWVSPYLTLGCTLWSPHPLIELSNWTLIMWVLDTLFSSMLLGLSFWNKDKFCLLLPYSLTGTDIFLSMTGGDATAAQWAASFLVPVLSVSIFPPVSFRLWGLPFSFYQVVKTILDFFNLGGASLSLGNPPCWALCSCLWFS